MGGGGVVVVVVVAVAVVVVAAVVVVVGGWGEWWWWWGGGGRGVCVCVWGGRNKTPNCVRRFVGVMSSLHSYTVSKRSPNG